MSGLCVVFLFEMMDNSILIVALRTIGKDGPASSTAPQWVTGAYAVVFGGPMGLPARSLTGTVADRASSKGDVRLRDQTALTPGSAGIRG